MCDQSTLVSVKQNLVPDWITDQLTSDHHLLNNYPDLYWATVFAFFATVHGHQAEWITVPCLHDLDRPGIIVADMVAVVPTLLDHHGLVPLRDSHQGRPHLPDYRHFRRARVDSLYVAFYQNLEFYKDFLPQNRINAADYKEKEQQIPVDACNGVLTERTEYVKVVRTGRGPAEYGKTSYEILQISCLWEHVRKFGAWLKVQLDKERPDSPKNSKVNQEDGRETYRIQLGFAMTILAQFRRFIGRMKGMAYDMVPAIDVAIAQAIADHRLMQNRERRVHYMATMLRLLYHSNTFGRRDGTPPLAHAVGLDPYFIGYLNYIRVSHPDWNADWPEAAMLAPGLQIPSQPVRLEPAYSETHWVLLRLISILPPLVQMTNAHFMDLFVDSMVQPVDHRDQRRQRCGHTILVEDSNRLRTEVNGGVANQVRQLDPLDVRAKIVWLLFMMPYFEQEGTRVRLAQNPWGGGAAAAGGGGRGGPQNRPGGQGYGRGGQGQMPPNPPQYPNPGNFGPNYGNQPWDNTGTDSQVRASGAMDGEIDGSEAKKLQDELDDPIEQSFNDLNSS